MAAGVFACAPSPVPGEEQKPAVVSRGNDPASKLVNRWFREGKAAGLKGIWYDNRDRKHSDLRIATYPQMQPITYSEAELRVRADWGGQRKLLPGKVVVGNSSTASPANQAGSHQRMYYLHPKGLPFLYQQYRQNALYVYPEHRDHDPGTNGPDGYGDLYPANSPYLISSQGSSGSDKAFMHAVLKTIAAFPPDLQEQLIAKGYLMPTVQAIFRRAYKATENPEDYFTGKAHPSAFDGTLLDEVAMVKLAQSMTAERIPPIVHLKVTDEPEVVPGSDFFEPEQRTGETIGDSPCAIARVIRGPKFRRSITVSAGDSVDLEDRELKFRWEILRGDPELITIETRGEHGEGATITVGYHPRRPIAPGSPLRSNRVDIGVFAEAEGSLVSAPAFVSFTSLANQHRTYDEEGRLLEIFYGARSRALGMPLVNGDRWDDFLGEWEKPEAERALGMRLLAGRLGTKEQASLNAASRMTRESRSTLSEAGGKLAAITGKQQKAVDETNKVRLAAVTAHKKEPTDQTKKALDRANAKHNAAKKVMREGADGAAELKKEIAGLRAKLAASLRENGVGEIVRSGLDALRTDPQFLTKHDEAIRGRLGDSIKTYELIFRRIESVSVAVSEDPPLNERYHLEQGNLDVLSAVLFPDFLRRPAGPLYVDPRLTIPRHWRDVYHYDDGGELSGWTRFQDGEKFEFTADGELIKSQKEDGSPDEVVPVRYVFEPKGKRLKMEEVETPVKGSGDREAPGSKSDPEAKN